jgi:hypothetical protein
MAITVAMVSRVEILMSSNGTWSICVVDEVKCQGGTVFTRDFSSLDLQNPRLTRFHVGHRIPLRPKKCLFINYAPLIIWNLPGPWRRITLTLNMDDDLIPTQLGVSKPENSFSGFFNPEKEFQNRRISSPVLGKPRIILRFLKELNSTVLRFPKRLKNRRKHLQTGNRILHFT